MASTWNETCPHCGHDHNMQSIFCDQDYETDFTFACHACGKRIKCHVHMVPEFELSEDDDD